MFSAALNDQSGVLAPAPIFEIDDNVFLTRLLLQDGKDAVKLPVIGGAEQRVPNIG